MSKRLLIALVIGGALLTTRSRVSNINSWSAGEVDNVVRRRGVPLQSYWKSPPDLVICDDVTTIPRVRKAVEFWEKLGYSFGSVSHDNNPLSCYSEEIGKIKIQLPSTDDPMGNNMAITRTSRYAATGEALYSTIKIMSHEAGRPLILEHEIGHALGWMHSPNFKHIMHPEYVSVGTDTDGVRHDDYLSAIYITFPAPIPSEN